MARPTWPSMIDDDSTGLTGTVFNIAFFDLVKAYIQKGLELKNLTELTIDAAGAVTITEAFHTIDTYEDAASDDLETINGGTAGALLVIKPADGARTVVVKHDADNIWLKSQADVSLDDLEDALILIYTGSKWTDLGPGAAAAAGADFYSRALIVDRWLDLDSLWTNVGLGGAVTQGNLYLSLVAAATQYSVAQARIRRYPFVYFDKDIDAQFLIKPSSLAVCTWCVGLGWPGSTSGSTNKDVVFYYEGGVLFAHVANGSAQSTENIAGVDASLWHRYKIHYEAATKADFYVDGVLKATITSNLPTHPNPEGGLHVSMVTLEAVTKSLYVSLVEAEQDW